MEHVSDLGYNKGVHVSHMRMARKGAFNTNTRLTKHLPLIGVMAMDQSTSIYSQLQFNFDTDEKWQSITGYEGLYEVSNFGRVRRLLSRTSGKAGAILKPQLNSNGYHHVILYKNKAKWCVRMHILVMMAFVGDCPTGMEVNHIHGIKTDNRLSELEYVTHSENIKHRYSVLGHKPTVVCGESRANSKLKEVDVKAIRSEFKAGFVSKSELARRYNVNHKTIRNIVNMVKWKHVLS